MAGVLISGLAAIWLFTVINLEGSPLSPVRRLLQRTEIGRKFVACPWCFGFWLAAAAYLSWTASVSSWDAVRTPLGVLAAAALVGLSGGILPLDDDQPTEF